MRPLLLARRPAFSAAGALRRASTLAGKRIVNDYWFANTIQVSSSVTWSAPAAEKASRGTFIAAREEIYGM
jgi:hypothetical protein